MEGWLKQVKDDWNKTADSEWYSSLRTDEKIEELVNNPISAFHPAVYELIRQSCEKIQSINNWESNPMAALPAWITIISQK